MGKKRIHIPGEGRQGHTDKYAELAPQRRPKAQTQLTASMASAPTKPRTTKPFNVDTGSWQLRREQQFSLSSVAEFELIRDGAIRTARRHNIDPEGQSLHGLCFNTLQEHQLVAIQSKAARFAGGPEVFKEMLFTAVTDQLGELALKPLITSVELLQIKHNERRRSATLTAFLGEEAKHEVLLIQQAVKDFCGAKIANSPPVPQIPIVHLQGRITTEAREQFELVRALPLGELQFTPLLPPAIAS